MDIVLSSLKDTQLLLIVCDTEARAQLHEYLDRYFPTMGHTGLLLPIFDYQTYGRMKCGECEQWNKAEAHQSSLPNNYGLAWSAYCSDCGTHQWDDEYYHDSDIYEVLRTHRKNNAIVIGRTIKVAKSERVLASRGVHTEADICESTIHTIFDQSITCIIDMPPTFQLYGSTGRKGRGRLQRRKEVLAQCIIEQIRH